MRTFLIFIFVAVVSLSVYNPEMDDFKTFLEKSSRQTARQQEHTSFTDRMFNADTTTAETKPTGLTTERNNYFLFSTYRITRVDDFHEVEEGRFLGIATMFFRLDGSGDMTAQVTQP